MSERKWLPAEFMDELPPMTATNPDDFLWRSPDGVLMLSLADEMERRDDLAEPMLTRPIQPGELIEFFWNEDRGHRTIQISQDGSWTIDAPFPGDTTNIYDVDTEILEDSVDQFVHAFVRDCGELLPTTVDVHGYVWEDGNFFRVEVAESGAARLVKQ